MPTSEQPTTPSPTTVEGMPDATAPEAQEQRYRTIAVRVEESVHTQLQFLSDLAGTNLSEEVRRAIVVRIASAQEDPQLIERAQRAREEIERDAAARTAAIAGFMGQTATAGATARPRSTTHSRSTKARN